ncbi:MAG TPA: hypothetical protein VM368_06225 [Flavisolibacter sp.]|nr:hypothetical protein [Flavisolibacter sp.]
MMKKIVFVALVVLSSFISFAQDEEQMPEQPKPEQKGLQKENVFIGGNFGVAFGNYTLINISPQIGYRFNKTLAAGVGLNLLYVSEKRRDLVTGNAIQKTSQGITGLNVFGRVYPVKFIMLQVQPEMNYRFGSVRYYDNRDPQRTKLDAEIIPSLLAGGGFVMPSERGAFIISFMYDLLQNENSPYGNKPVVNFGYTVNLR